MANRASKDKRYARNRAKREAQAARADTARERARASAKADGASGDGSTEKRGFFSRLIKPEPRTPSDRGRGNSERAERPPPVRGRPEGPMPRDDRGQVPGHRAALFSLFFAAASVGMLLFVPIPIDRNIDTPADAEPGCEVATTTTTVADSDAEVDEEQLTCRESVTIPDELGLIAFPILMIPIVITGFGFWATRRDRQSRIWTFCLVGFAGFLVIFTLGGLLFIPSMVALTIASFQSRRAEQKLLLAERAAGIGSSGTVIDTTATSDDEADD